jgi:hypothetical protein
VVTNERRLQSPDFSTEDRKIERREEGEILGRHLDSDVCGASSRAEQRLLEQRNWRISLAPKLFARPSDLSIFL